MLEDPPAELVGLLQDGGGDTGLGLRQEGGQPLAVDVDTVLDSLVFTQRQGQAVTDHFHEPDHLCLSGQRRRLRVFGRRQAQLRCHSLDNGRHHSLGLVRGQF